MALIPLPASSGTGVRYTLQAGVDALVAKDTLITSTDSDAIIGQGADTTVTVAGKVSGVGHAIYLGNDYMGDAGCAVTVQKGGIISASGQAAILFEARDFTVTNAGKISGGDYGIGFVSLGDGQSTITNSGAISGSTAAIMRLTDGISTQTVKLVNTGVIKGGANYIGGYNEGRDIIVNQGRMLGTMTDLGSGNDLFDNRGGVVKGYVLGGNGADLFRPGASAENFNGDAMGFPDTARDTLDFRSAKRISVNMEDGSHNTGRAKGDSYQNFENLLGSKAGGDRLFANGLDNLIRGYGGADTIGGGAGADTILGGTGRDVLFGGGSGDMFQFSTLREAGDRIADFGSSPGNDDVIALRASSFGGGLTAGTLAAGQFHRGATNLANDADCRFILRTGDDTLWFDADGKGGKAAILVADLGDVTFRHDDILVY